MDQKPTSRGVRNKQKQNKALAFGWKAVSGRPGPEPKAGGRWVPARRMLLLEKPGGDRAWGSSGSPPARGVPWPLSCGVPPRGPGCGGHGCGGTEGTGKRRHLPGGPEMASPPLGECAVSQFKQNPGGNCSTMNSQLSSVSIKLVKLLVKKRKRQKQQFTCRAIVLFFAGYFPTSPCSFRFLNFLK